MIALDCISDLYAPPDTIEANELWGASCGPCALAAMAAVPVTKIRPHLGDYEKRGGYMNFTHMLAACASLRIKANGKVKDWSCVPAKLCLIQFGGPWLKPGVPVAAAYRYTHWTAVIGTAAYDCNCPFWISKTDWAAHVITDLLRETPRADGTWSVRKAIAVDICTLPGKHRALHG